MHEEASSVPEGVTMWMRGDQGDGSARDGSSIALWFSSFDFSSEMGPCGKSAPAQTRPITLLLTWRLSCGNIIARRSFLFSPAGYFQPSHTNAGLDDGVFFVLGFAAEKRSAGTLCATRPFLGAWKHDAATVGPNTACAGLEGICSGLCSCIGARPVTYTYMLAWVIGWRGLMQFISRNKAEQGKWREESEGGEGSGAVGSTKVLRRCGICGGGGGVRIDCRGEAESWKNDSGKKTPHTMPAIRMKASTLQPTTVGRM